MRKITRDKWPVIFVGIFSVLFIPLMVWVIQDFLAEETNNRPVIRQITLLTPPPPPPPVDEPPPPPPPPEIEEQVETPEPETPEPVQEAQNEPPASEDLGVDAQGSGEGDGFGLVGKPGGRDLLLGGKGGDARRRYAWYTALIQDRIEERIRKDERLKAYDFRVVVKLWLDARGRVERYELATGTGDTQTDALVRTALQDLARISEAPPLDMPQPVKLRITSRQARL